MLDCRLLIKIVPALHPQRRRKRPSSKTSLKFMQGMSRLELPSPAFAGIADGVAFSETAALFRLWPDNSEGHDGCKAALPYIDRSGRSLRSQSPKSPQLGVHMTQVQPQTTRQTAPREYLATTDGGYLSQVHTQFAGYRAVFRWASDPAKHQWRAHQ